MTLSINVDYDDLRNQAEWASQEVGHYDNRYPETCATWGFREQFTPQVALELLAEREKLRAALGGFVWIGNNLHNIKSDPERFRSFYEAALEDAREALGMPERIKR